MTLIYCDYDALSGSNRKLMMKKAYDCLRPGEGSFWTSVQCAILKPSKKARHGSAGRRVLERGHMPLPSCQSEVPNWTALDQTVAITRDKMTRYYIWNHCFTKESLANEAREAGFIPVQVFNDVAGQQYLED